MPPRGPPFDFDLNEPPPPEDDGVKGIPAPPVPEPLSAQQDPLLADPVPEPSAQQDPLPPAPVPEPSAQQDPLPQPAPEPELTTAHVPLPARSLAPAPAPEASTDEPLPAPPPRAPVPVPSPSPHHHLPSPVLDLEAPLSPLDDEDEDEADLPLPPPPPFPLPPPPPLPPSYRFADTSDALTVSSGGHGGDAGARLYSSPETWAPRGSRAAASDTTSSHGSRRRPYSCDDAISKQRRVVDDYDDEDGGGPSSRSGSRRSEFGSPRRYERSGGPAPPRRRYYGQDGGRRAPAAGGQPGPGAPARNRRSRRRAQRPQHGFHQYGGPVQNQQGFLGQERPQVHHGPRGPEVPKVGYASYNPRDSSGGARLSPEQEPGNGWHQRQCSREREAPPAFRPSSRPHGRQQEPPEIGGYHHREREAPSFRPLPSSGTHGGGRDDGSSGRRHIPEEKPVTGGAHHQQTTVPRGGRDDHFPDRAYHPYPRRRSGFDRPLDGGRDPVRREPPDSYEHRRYSKQQVRSGGPARGRQYYGDVQE